MLCGRFFTKDGATKYPNLMLLFGLIHHSIAAVLVIPMVIYYRTLRPFHWLIFDLQFAGGMTKWRNKCVEYESLPADAPEAQRRKTMLDLQDSVNDLILEESLNERIITEDRIRLFIDALNEKRDVERRHTMPPSRAKMAWGSTRLMRGLSVPPHMWSNKDD